MAWESPYGTPQGYRQYVGKVSESEDAVILSQLTAFSRYLERRMNRVFNKTTSGTEIVLDPPAKDLLPLLPDLVIFESLDVDTTGDGTYDTALASGDLIFRPLNASLGSEPYTHLELHPNQSAIGGWPSTAASIKVTGTFGWPAVPAAITEAVYALVRQWRDLLEGGAAIAVQNIDNVVQQTPEMRMLLAELRNQYWRPAF